MVASTMLHVESPEELIAEGPHLQRLAASFPDLILQDASLAQRWVSDIHRREASHFREIPCLKKSG